MGSLDDSHEVGPILGNPSKVNLATELTLREMLLIQFGYCPLPVTVYIRGTFKGYA